MTTPPVHTGGALPRPDIRPGDNQPGGMRECQRQAITEHFLTALEEVVWRYRRLAGGTAHPDIAPETVTAEVAHHLWVARSSLRRHPAVGRPTR